MPSPQAEYKRQQLLSAYDSYRAAQIEATRAEMWQNKFIMERALASLTLERQSFLDCRNAFKECWEMELELMRMVQAMRMMRLGIPDIEIELAILIYTAKIQQEQQEFLVLSGEHQRTSSSLRLSIDIINAREAAAAAINLRNAQRRDNERGDTTTNAAEAATVNPHDAQLRGNEQGDTTTNATEAATVNPHDAQLRDDEQKDTTTTATEAATVNPHDAQLRGNEQGDTTTNATEAATVNPHDAQLRDDEQEDTTTTETEAATVNPHDAQLRDNEQGDTESDTRRRDEADLDHNGSEPEQKKRKKDSSQVMPDNDPDDNA